MSSSDHFITEEGVRKLVLEACRCHAHITQQIILEIQRISKVCVKLNKIAKKHGVTVTMEVPTKCAWFFNVNGLPIGAETVFIEFR